MNIRKLMVFLMVVFFPVSSSYACNYKDNGDGTQTDPQSGVVWQRNGVGSGDWFFAMKQAKNSKVNGMTDWRLPTKNELRAFMDSGCSGNQRMFYWSISANGTSSAWLADIQQGKLWDYPREGSSANALLVRGGQSSGQAEYDQEYKKYILPLEQQAAENARKKAENIRLEAEWARQAAIAQKKEDARQKDSQKLFNKQLASKKPQEMYIAAGKYEAKKDYERATKLYDAIIERFPDHDMAVKATDRLTSLKDAENSRRSNEETASEATRNARSMARQACQNDVNACYARKGSNCYRNCDF